MKKIKLSNINLYFMVDDEDEWRVNLYNWFLNTTQTSYQIQSKIDGRTENIATYIMGKGMYDHIDRNVFNNQKLNLRLATWSQNAMNRSYPSRNKYIGITKHGPSWQAQIAVNYQKIHLGTFKTEELAAKAYDEAAKKYHGNFAKLNFPIE